MRQKLIVLIRFYSQKEQDLVEYYVQRAFELIYGEDIEFDNIRLIDYVKNTEPNLYTGRLVIPTNQYLDPKKLLQKLATACFKGEIFPKETETTFCNAMGQVMIKKVIFLKNSNHS